MRFFVVLLLCGQMFVGCAASNEPSGKDCKVVMGKYGLVLDCTNKGFKSIPKDIFELAVASTEIKLGNNPYVCDCDIKWFLLIVQGDRQLYKSEKIQDYNKILCQEPPSLKGEEIKYLTENVCKGKKVKTTWVDCNVDLYDDVLDCSGLDMESVPKDIFDTHLSRLKLGRNPYNCNCSMKWFVNRLKNHNYELVLEDDHHMSCAKPKKLAGRQITQLSEEDVCSSKVYSGHCKMKQPCDEKTSICLDTETSHKCIDIDECANKSQVCHAEAKCKNHVGGYDCICNTGYTGDGKTCTDIDECLIVKCGKKSNCQNTNGSYECVCNKGFSKKDKVCSDIDECADKIADCHKDAECLNTIGSYRCVCKPGYNDYYGGHLCEKQVTRSCSTKPCVGDNEKCVDNKEDHSFKCVCQRGFARKSRIGGCEDMNECVTGTPCSVHGKCENTVGSYKCSCKKGYAGDGKQCADVDECAGDDHDCHRDAICINHVGGYKCRCKAGFQELKDGRLCLKEAKKANLGVGTIIVIVFVAFLFFFLITLAIFVSTRKKTRQKKAAMPHEKEFMFLYDSDLLEADMEHIPPTESTVTEWSEDEDMKCNDSNSSDYE